MIRGTINNYEDLLEGRRQDFSHFVWSSKKVDAAVAYKQKIRATPSSHKLAVLKDKKIQQLIARLSEESNVPKNQLLLQVKDILDEIGYNKDLRVIRWIGLVLVKLCLRMTTGIYINKDSIFHEKSLLGKCPVIFVPSHRSYADFILMSLVCYTYDVEIPAIAAGMDFHGMWGMGSMLRDTGAFFMRRTYNDDHLYWVTFKQYVNQLVTKGELPIEFFIEGTRSRSNKSLAPKFGLLNMILKPLFLRQVPDILFVPINISYERILEEKLFAYELLGIPKPKESTKGFLRSLNIIKEKFGSVFISVGTPISSKEFFGEEIDRSTHNLGPIHNQELSEYDKKIIPRLAHEIIDRQQKHCILNPINLIAIILNYHLTYFKQLMTVEDLQNKLTEFHEFLNNYNAIVNIKDVSSDILHSLLIHKDIIQLNDGKIDLRWTSINLDNLNAKKLKAFKIPDGVMSYSLPFILLYIYINPVLYYLIDSALIVTILQVKSGIGFEVLANDFVFLRNLFLYEFVMFHPNIPQDYKRALDTVLNLDIVVCTNGKYSTKNNYWRDILLTVIQPFLYSYSSILDFLGQVENVCKEKTIYVEIQKKHIFEMKRKFVHPYCLNLDTISNCLQALTFLNHIKREKRNYVNYYSILNKNGLIDVKKRLGQFNKIFGKPQAININYLAKL